MIALWLNRKDIPAELELDVVSAAEQHKVPAIEKGLAERVSRRSKSDPLAPYRMTLRGGDPAKGHRVFYEKAEAACNGCHEMLGDGGEVGPELTHSAGKQGAEYLLESILFPNVKIAQGFESVMVTSKNGSLYASVLKSETASVLEINSPEDGIIKVNKSDISSRAKGLSGMPEGYSEILRPPGIARPHCRPHRQEVMINLSPQPLWNFPVLPAAGKRVNWCFA